jgi:DNA invertase Pin-like site-specific DNA recombinase
MSTEHQQYSTENQLDAIGRYAHANGMQIARIYSDSGKSGLNLAGREGLRDLLHDVENGRADYSVILVYDVSRWGRFQDADISQVRSVLVISPEKIPIRFASFLPVCCLLTSA